MFTRKVKSVFDKLKQNSRKPSHPIRNISILAIKSFSKPSKTTLHSGKWAQRIDELVYIVQGPKNTHKRHMNQLRKCRLNESEVSPQNTCEEPIDAIFDHFDLYTPQVSPEVRHSGRKRKRKSQEEEILIVLFFPRKKNLLEVGVVGPKLTCIMDSSSTILLAEQ